MPAGAARSPGTSRQLAAQGPAGQAVERLAASTAPPLAGGPRRGGGAQGAHRRAAAASGQASGTSGPAAGGEGLIAGLLGPIVSGSAPGGTGPLLPTFLIVVLAAGLAATLIRRRARR